MEASPEELRRSATEVFQATHAPRSVQDLTRPGETFLGEMPLGDDQKVVVSRRKRIGARNALICFRTWTVSPDGPTEDIAFHVPAQALPVFAGLVACALEAELDDMPGWARESEGSEREATP
jgi:hypothetical protein